MLLEAFKALAQDVGGNAFGRGGEIPETFASHKQVADDQQCPAVAEDIEGAGDRAGGAAGCAGGLLASFYHVSILP